MISIIPFSIMANTARHQQAATAAAAATVATVAVAAGVAGATGHASIWHSQVKVAGKQ